MELEYVNGEKTNARAAEEEEGADDRKLNCIRHLGRRASSALISSVPADEIAPLVDRIYSMAQCTRPVIMIAN